MKWVDVQSKFPKEPTDVLIHVQGEVIARVGLFDGKTWCTWKDDFVLEPVVGVVDYWMPFNGVLPNGVCLVQ